MNPAASKIYQRLDKILRELVLIQYEVDTLPDALSSRRFKEFNDATRRAVIRFNAHLEGEYGREDNDS